MILMGIFLDLEYYELLNEPLFVKFYYLLNWEVTEMFYSYKIPWQRLN